MAGPRPETDIPGDPQPSQEEPGTRAAWEEKRHQDTSPDRQSGEDLGEEGLSSPAQCFPSSLGLCCYLIFGRGSGGAGEKGLWSNVFGNTSYALCLTPILYIKGSENSCN